MAENFKEEIQRRLNAKNVLIGELNYLNSDEEDDFFEDLVGFVKIQEEKEEEGCVFNMGIFKNCKFVACLITNSTAEGDWKEEKIVLCIIPKDLPVWQKAAPFVKFGSLEQQK
jgi:hypothetical protein